MRYEKGHKDASRQRILEVAARRFQKEGVAAVGIASLMSDVGLTHGGFYSHFASKEDLASIALAQALEHSATILAQAARDGGIAAMICTYLQSTHRDNPDRGCAIASVAAEIARHPVETRAALTLGMEKIIDLFACYLPHADPQMRRDRALQIFSSLVGALQLARMVSDSTLSERILRNGEIAALALAEIT
jgi:TetR/AcrR family transcriptional regulator, transcriptional repressor for nem operon